MLVVAGSDSRWPGQTTEARARFSAESSSTTVDGPGITALAVQDGTLYVSRRPICGLWAPITGAKGGSVRFDALMSGASTRQRRHHLSERSVPHRGIEPPTRGGSPVWIGEGADHACGISE